MRMRIWASLLAGTAMLAGCGSMPGIGQGGDTKVAAASATTPGWAKQAVFYQIFPERFANGDPSNDPADVQPWGTKPAYFNFMGGDLQGVTQKLSYLHDLGVTALYFNPIFTSSSNHKYNTGDYMHVDPHFGGDAAFQKMLSAAHGMGMKVLLDGVFNHTGDDSVLFQDCKAKGPASPYWNWYTIWGFPVVTDPKPNYNSWWGFGTLPQLKAATNPDVQNYIYSVEEHWLKMGIDGWRLDVPNEIDSDPFWRGFRSRAKAINPNAYIVGEIWTDASRWLQGDQFDAVMNYPWRDMMIDFFASGATNVDQFDQKLYDLRAHYDPEITSAMFNILGSHDVPRFLTVAGNDVRKLKMAALFQMTYVGAPVIYYGDEIGMQGDKDPDNRRCFDWNPANQNQDLKGYYQKLIALRKAVPALSTGAFRSIRRHNDFGLYAYARELGASKAVVMLNNSEAAHTWPLDVSTVFANGTALVDGLSGQAFTVSNGTVNLSLTAKQGVVLVPASNLKR